MAVNPKQTANCVDTRACANCLKSIIMTAWMSMPQNCVYWLHNTITRSLSIAPMLVENIVKEIGGDYELRVKVIRAESCFSAGTMLQFTQSLSYTLSAVSGNWIVKLTTACKYYILDCIFVCFRICECFIFVICAVIFVINCIIIFGEVLRDTFRHWHRQLTRVSHVSGNSVNPPTVRETTYRCRP